MHIKQLLTETEMYSICGKHMFLIYFQKHAFQAVLRISSSISPCNVFCIVPTKKEHFLDSIPQHIHHSSTIKMLESSHILKHFISSFLASCSHLQAIICEEISLCIQR